MNHYENTLHRACTFAALIFSLVPLHGANPQSVAWNRVCEAAGSREMILTTAAGATVEGVCLTITVDQIAIKEKDGTVVKLARHTLARLRVGRGHQLRALGKGLHGAFHEGFAMLLSPLAPAGIVSIPGTLAWGAIAAPFCLIADLTSKTFEIKPI